MSRDLIRLMSVLFTHRPERCPEVPWRPSADVYRTTTGWLLKFELAGVRAEEIELDVLGGRLTVAGLRRDTVHEDAVKKEEPTCVHHRMEIDYGRFARAVDLPCDLQKAEIRSDYRDGLLLIHVTPDE